MWTPRLVVPAALVMVTLTVPWPGTVGPANADTPRCVSGAEYRKIHKGMSRGKVHRIFDTKGRSLFENPGAVHNSAREYRMCSGFAAATGDTKVQVQYNNYAANGGPQLVAFKQHY